MLGIRMRRVVEAGKGVNGVGLRRVSGLEGSTERNEIQEKAEIGGVSDDKLASSLFDELSAVFKSVKEVGSDSKASRSQRPARRMPVPKPAVFQKPQTVQDFRSHLKMLFEERKYVECMMTFVKLQPNHRRKLGNDRACFLYAIAAGSKAHYTRVSVKFLDEMEEIGLETDETVYRAALIGIESAQAELGEALDLFERMKHRGIAPTVETYNSVLRSCANRGQMQSGMDLVDEMKRNGIEPNQDTFAALVTGFSWCKQLYSAVEWSEKMESEFGSLPPVVTFELLASLANKYHHAFLTEAWAKYQQSRRGAAAVEAPLLPIGVYVAMMRCGEKFCDADFCLDVLKQLRTDHPKQVPNDACYGAVNACGIQGRFEEAFELLATMSEEERAPMTADLRGLVIGLSRGVEEVDRGYYILEARRSGNQKVYLPEMNAVLAACAELGDAERTIQTFEEAISSFALQPTVETYEILLRMADRSGQLSRISSLIAEMQQRGLPPTRRGLETLALALVKKAKEENAIAMLENGIKTGVMPTNKVLGALNRRMTALRKLGQAKTANGAQFNFDKLDTWSRALVDLAHNTKPVRLPEPPSINRDGKFRIKDSGNPDAPRGRQNNRNNQNSGNRGNQPGRRNRDQQEGAGTPASGVTAAVVPADGAVTGGAADPSDSPQSGSVTSDLMEEMASGATAADAPPTGAMMGGAADRSGSPGSDSFTNHVIEQGDLLDEMMSQVEAQQSADADAGAGTPAEEAAAAEQGNGSTGSAESVQVQGAEGVEEATDSAADSAADGPSDVSKTKSKQAPRSKKGSAQKDGADQPEESATP